MKKCEQNDMQKQSDTKEKNDMQEKMDDMAEFAELIQQNMDEEGRKKFKLVLLGMKMMWEALGKSA